MNKVVSINLNGNAYQLDEQGFAAISAYLEQAKSRLSDNPDQAEILADIEQAIADKLQRFLSAHKSVVSADEVDTVIAEMGPVDGDADAERTSQAAAGPKRLYRIPEGEILGGVATGFAAYFGVDVVLIRIIMIVLLILTGGGFAFGYLLAWVFIPPAHTQEEQAKAHGAPFNAEEIIARTKAAVERGHAEGMKQWNAWKHEHRAEHKANRRAHKRAYKYSYDWQYGRHHSSFGDLFGLIFFIFLAWLGYHHVSVIHQFLDSVWMFVESVGNWIAQLILAHQK